MQEATQSRPADGNVVAHALRIGELPFYSIPDDGLDMGASLGNSVLWVTTLGTGAVQQVFHVGLGELLLNTVCLRFAGRGHRPIGPTAATAGTEEKTASYVGLVQETPGRFILHPAYQRHEFVIAGAVHVTETTFVPLNEPVTAGDAPVLYQMVQLHNEHPYAINLRVFAYARLRGSLGDDVQARFDSALRALVAHNASKPEAVRVFGLSERPSGYATSFDFDRVYDPLHVRLLENSVEAKGDILGCLQLDLHLEANERHEFAVVTALSGSGEADALAAYRAAGDGQDALDTTLAHLRDTLAHGQVLTPDPLINQGALWSKVNMRRVMALYPQGPAFTNEPGGSSNVVGRDAAWFVYGNDHFLPDFSRVLLDTFARLQYENGKIPEYYSALTGRVEDYGLNINDDTPLFILAVNHHFRATGDRAWLRRVYPVVAKAARYIISQEDERGLVYCSAKDPRGNVWAIASWRNVIPQYTLNGAVTEINAECAAALRAAGHMAQNLGQPDAEAKALFDAAAALRASMNEHLLNPANGLYYLNIDADGNIHTDVTGDEIFPVMFRVCEPDVGFRIISRLNSPDFWTTAGLRTASRHDPLYDPFRFVGLIGGVWPGLTWWYAFAARQYHPEFMVQALRASFRHYAAHPKVNNTVPGQFSEWFDGESLVNRGMRLSPWEPPRFMWAAVEGVCGLMLSPDQPSVNPVVPDAWKWVAIRRLPYHGSEITYFAGREDGQFRIYATADIKSDEPIERYDEDVTPQIHCLSAAAAVVALRRAGNLLVLVGNASAGSIVAPVGFQELLDPGKRYQFRVYNSERQAWEEGHEESGEAAATLALSIESGGYRVVEITAAG